jgi:hypothetical protein
MQAMFLFHSINTSSAPSRSTASHIHISLAHYHPISLFQSIMLKLQANQGQAAPWVRAVNMLNELRKKVTVNCV